MRLQTERKPDLFTLPDGAYFIVFVHRLTFGVRLAFDRKVNLFSTLIRW